MQFDNQQSLPAAAYSNFQSYKHYRIPVVFALVIEWKNMAIKYITF